MIRILVVDDETLARERIKSLLLENFNLKNCAEACNYNEALEQIKLAQPQLIFLDIQMPGQSGLDLAELINSLKIPIIFTTAHSEYALQAFDQYTIDYLLKPIRKEHLERALEKYWRTAKDFKLTIKFNGNDILLSPTDIYYLEAMDSYVNIVTATKEYLITDTIENLEESLKKWGFERSHRSYIVNTNHIKEIVRLGDRQYEISFGVLHLKNIKIGRSFLEKFK